MASAIRNLTERRVPHVLAVYLGAAFGVVQFVDFVGSRYLLPAIWTDLTLLTMALLLPSVLLYTYNHGRPGPDDWRRSEKIFIPVNLVLLATLVSMVGAGEALGPTSKRIIVKDEKGNTREAVVPNKAYRKRVAFFMFDSPADSASQWLRFGMPQMTWQDLLQQNFIEVLPPIFLREGLTKKGFASGVDVPLSLKREVANELHVPHFVSGRVEKSGNEYVATVQIYETASVKLVQERTYRSADATQLADQVSAGLIKDLNIPTLSDAKPDMPVSEILSKNPQALRAYVDAAAALQIENDFARATQSIARSVQQDPTFASAHLIQYAVALLSNQPELAAAAIQKAMDHSYRMPERVREMIKADYYMVKQDYGRAFGVLDMLAQLYPEDITVQQQLMQVNVLRDNKDAVIKSIKNVLELDPTRSELMLELAEMYEAKGESKQALEQYTAYSAKHPQDPRALRKSGNLQRRLGAHALARAAYEKALLVAPDDVESLVQLATLERNTGAFAAAEQKYQEALGASKTPEQRRSALHGMAGFYEFRGDVRTSIRNSEAALVELGKYAPPAAVIVNGMMLPSDWARIDRAMAEKKLQELRQQMKAPFDMYLPMAELQTYVELEDIARAEQAALGVENFVKNQNFQLFRSIAMYGRGRIAELKGDCDAAIRQYREVLQLNPLDASTHADIGRCQRKLGKRSDAEAELNKLLGVVPANGAANLEMGLLFKDAGDAAKARSYLQRALQTWQNADPTFKPARQAREALSALK